MAEPTKKKMVVLDGRTGEGGGQLVRIAACLSALTGTPIRIHHVRGNRGGGKKNASVGGLKAQHSKCIKWLAQATQAELTGSAIGSKEFTMIPRSGPAQFRDRNIRIHADTAASVLLVFQAIFPFLIFAGDGTGEPITVTIMGGTNVSFSLSFDYLDQVVLPSLELFGVPQVERKLEYRGWSHGRPEVGSIKFKFTPLAPNISLRTSLWPKFSGPGFVERINISMVVSHELQDPLKECLKFELDLVFPGVETSILVDDDSRHPARLYVLLVAHTENGFRFGRDWLYDKKLRGKSTGGVATEIAQKVVDELDAEVRKGGCVDEYLQDQLVVFQALAEGRSTIDSSAAESNGSSDEIFVQTCEPFGNGSLHTRSAKWVVSQLLPQIRWLDNGRVCEGIGFACKAESTLEEKINELTLQDPVKQPTLTV